MDRNIQEFCEISQQIGNNPFWVQGPGGNTSIKLSDGRMIVKSSGSELGAVTMDSGYTFVNPAEVNVRLEQLMPGNSDMEVQYATIVENCGDPRFKRPSMELGFHTWLGHKYVLHFHSPAAILAEHCDDCTCPFEIETIPLLLPGLALSKAIMHQSKQSILGDRAILLQNHGIILAIQEKPFGAIEKYCAWEKKFWSSLNPKIEYNLVSDRNRLYQLAAAVPVENSPLFPDSVVMESRISAIVDYTQSGTTTLDLAKASNDIGAADLYSIQTLTRLTAPDYRPLPESICNEIRNLPTELARKKLMEMKQ